MHSSLKYSCQLIACISILGLAAGCNSSTSALGTKSETKSDTVQAETAAAEENAAEEANEEETARIINKPGKVKNRGGYIKILVNKTPITNFDIQRRKKFLQLRRAKGNRTKLAEKELIEQAIKLQEADLRGARASDQVVNAAFSNFAKRNRTTVANLSRELANLGIGAAHFKEFVRGQISWQRVIQSKFQAETSQSSERDVVTKLRKSGSAKPEVTEYYIQQIIFVVAKNKRNNSRLAARKAEANTFRQRFARCEDTLQQAKQLKDVSVIERRRLLEPELPEVWKDAIVNVDGVGTTRAKETERGIEVMAVCSKRVVNDDRAAQISSQSAEFESYNDKGSKISEDYLNELKKNSVIIYQ